MAQKFDLSEKFIEENHMPFGYHLMFIILGWCGVNVFTYNIDNPGLIELSKEDLKYLQQYQIVLLNINKKQILFTNLEGLFVPVLKHEYLSLV